MKILSIILIAILVSVPIFAQGTQPLGESPEIDVRGNGISILDGSTTANGADNTDFGNVLVGGTPLDHSFSIFNVGDEEIELSGAPLVSISGANESDFTVTLDPITPIDNLTESSFTITFQPGGVGLRTAIVSITNNDDDENPFDFVIQGTGIEVTDAPVVNSPIASGSTIVTGTSTEANGTVIDVYVNSLLVGSSSVTGGTWLWDQSDLLWNSNSRGGLIAGDTVKATATASGETTSPFSNLVIVQDVTVAPVVSSPITAGATSVSGTGPETIALPGGKDKMLGGTIIEVFVNSASVGTTSVNIGGSWTKPGLAALSTDDTVKAKATAINKLPSAFSNEVIVDAAVIVHTFIVTNTNDTGAGSFRQAILDANATENINSSTPDTILFNIPGSGPHTIVPVYEYPWIIDPVIIDGYSQPGSSENTLAVGNNAVLKIVLDRSSLPSPEGSSLAGKGDKGSADIQGGVSGLFILSNNTLVQGLVIGGFSNNGIVVNTPADGCIIRGNFIGTDATGSADNGNNYDGIILVGATNTVIGGTNPGDRNIISGNDDDGVHIYSSTNAAIVMGNYIGTNASGTGSLGNDAHGVHIQYSHGNTIGGLPSNSGNIIAFNGGHGVSIPGGINNTIDPNSIFGNTTLGIDLGDNGATSNDAGDGDTGPNNLQNFPEMTLAERQGNGDLSMTYSVPSTIVNSTYPLHIEFFKAAGGQGKTFIGSDSYTAAHAQLQKNITFTPAIAISYGDSIVATATDSLGNTSEFSAVKGVTEEQHKFVVITNADTGIGSFRWALGKANTTTNINASTPDTIAFNIPGSGPHTIIPQFVLPQIVDPVFINGYSQPGASENTLSSGNNAVLKIVLTGPILATDALEGPGTTGLLINAGGTIIQGLVLNGFTSSAMYIENANACIVRGNYIGTDATGMVDAGNNAGIVLENSASVLIGGTNPGDRNIISGNSIGIMLVLQATITNQIMGNYIGTDATGLGDLGNDNAGIDLSNSAEQNTIGGTIANAGNTIAYNGTNGISNLATQNSFLQNSMFANTPLGINNGFDGATPNDPGDADEGHNRLQNFPDIASAIRQGNGDLLMKYVVTSNVANATYPLRVEIFKAQGGQGRIFLGALTYASLDAEDTVSQTLTPLVAVAVGDTLVATATDSLGNTSEFSAVTIVASHKFVVTNTNDAGAGSLRQAILDANAVPNINAATPDTISFNIPGDGPHTVVPQSYLPEPVGPVFIDGYSQPGASENTLITGSNAILKIILSSPAIFSVESSGGTVGLTVTGTGSGTTIQGLVLNGFTYTGLYFNGAQSCTIRGNYIGTDASGMNDLGNLIGIYVQNSENLLVGGTNPGDRNIVSGNNVGITVVLQGSLYNVITGNYIGTDAIGTGDLGNDGPGIRFSTNADYNSVGGIVPNAGNVIAYNGGYGIENRSEHNRFLQNSMFGNAPAGIENGVDGPTPNDPGDADGGANRKQNFPDISTAVRQGNGDLQLKYIVTSATANSTYPLRIEFFKAQSGQGRTFLGALAYGSSDAEDTVSQTLTPLDAVAIGDTLVATATDSLGNTSEFSAVIVVTAPPATNVIQNPGFESGTSPWVFFTNANGNLTVVSPGPSSPNAAKVTLNTIGNNMQLYQAGITLQPNTQYRLTFKALSSVGHNLSVYLQRHTSPFTPYGINGQVFDLTPSWQTFTLDFTTTGFPPPTPSNARLRFRFDTFATPGDVYYIDDVSLTPLGSTLTATKVRVETAPDGGGSIVPAQTIENGETITMYAVSRTATDQFVANVSATWSLIAVIGTATPGDLVPSGDGKSAVFTGHDDCSVVVQALSGGLTPVYSDLITVFTPPSPTNLLANGGFESGTSNWSFQTNGTGSFSAVSPGNVGTKAGQISISTGGTIVQLYQQAVSLTAGNSYRLSFRAFSNTGHDVQASIFKHASPFTPYGLTNHFFNLTNAWAPYSVDFVAGGFPGTVTDGRLRFWLAPYDAAGDVYQFDDVKLELLPSPADGGVAMMESAVPSTFSLAQNFPNPFNPSTTIIYTLPVDARVTLEVVDMLGQRVATLVDGNFPAGYHEAIFDASTHASGMYLYRLKAIGTDGTTYTRTEKMLLTK